MSSATAAPVTLGYEPRAHQRLIHAAIDAPGVRLSVLLCHRRLGKTTAAINHAIWTVLECPLPRPRAAIITPTYRQGRLVCWDLLKLYTRHIPGVEQRESELAVNLPGDRRISIHGADNPDSLRGISLDLAVHDEYGLQPPNVFAEVVRPALADRAGRAVFLGTPNGRNEFWKMAQAAQANDSGEWAYQCYKASETGIIPDEELAAARRVMTADQYAQEFECSFEAAVQGSIYGTDLATARSEGRVTVVGLERALPVCTTWDLGVGDATSIIFSQHPRSGDVRVIDYYESSGEGLPHYASVLQQRAATQGYVYGQHWAPHDIHVRELGSGRSRIETAASLGLRFETVPRVHTSTAGEVEEGIHAGRLLLGRTWFDQTKTKGLLDALQHYRREFNARLQEFRATPVHDFASHGADAWRYLALWAKPVREIQTRVPRAYGMSGGDTWLSA
jgi:hypothetical protein